MAGMKDQPDTAPAGPRRSRRMLLAGGTGALAAVLTAEALARPAPAAADNGGNVILGTNNTETSATGITNSTGGALAVIANGTGTGLASSSTSGRAVDAFSSAGTGVRGQSGLPVSGFAPVTNGVHGLTDSFTGAGVIGENTGGGTAVGGISTTGDGVGGTSSGGNGVHGRAVLAAGVGVLAENDGGGTALQVAGPAAFSRSGTVTVAAGHSSAVKTGIALTAASLVLATIQGSVAGVAVQGVTLVTGTSGSFTIHLTKTVTANTKVAWFVIN